METLNNPVRADLRVCPNNHADLRVYPNNHADLCVCPTKETILNKTHYGLNIYSHILRFYYPDEVVIRLVGRDCELCRNPFNANEKTLHIYIHKERTTGSALDKEYARHRDTENAIPAGDAFTFAELHYKQQGDELLQTLNKELFLYIGEEKRRYVRADLRVCPNNHTPLVAPSNQPFCFLPSAFSFFKSPITNTIPHSQATLRQIYNAITGNYYKARTTHLRNLTNPKEARIFKASNFDYCTFSGTFTTRNDKAIIKHSGLLCIDFDHLQNLSEIKNRLLADEYFETQLLFTSPSGNGLKWVISIDTGTATHSDYFAAVSNYIKQTYQIEVDKSGRDLSRACFLPHDPQAYINPLLKNQH